MRRSSRFPGRTAHSTRSARQDSSWDSDIAALHDTSEGVMTRREYLAKKQRTADPKRQFSMYLGPKRGSRFSRQTCSCGGRIAVWPDGRAVCNNPKCSTVFNDGGQLSDNEDGGLGSGNIATTYHYSDGSKKEVMPKKPPPRKHEKDSMRGMHRFIEACRA